MMKDGRPETEDRSGMTEDGRPKWLEELRDVRCLLDDYRKSKIINTEPAVDCGPSTVDQKL
jgi:hypothetical protein